MKKERIIIVTLFLVLGVFSLFARPGNESEAFIFKYSNAQNETHPRTQSMFYFKEELEKRSGGRIEVEMYHSGVLGTEKEQFDQLATGIIQGYRGAYYELINPQYYIYNLPFLFADADEVIRFNNSDFMKAVNKKSSDSGNIYIPAVGSSGFRNIVNTRRALEMTEDFNGISFRSPSQMPIIEFYRTLGAKPQEMSSSEVYLALKSGIIDGACSSNADLDSWKVAEVTDYLTVINYVNGADPFMVNKSWYETLPKDLKKIFDEVSIDTMIKSDELRKEGEIRALENLRKDIAQVNVIEGSLRRDFQEKLKPVWDKLIAEGYFTQQDIDAAQLAMK